MQQVNSLSRHDQGIYRMLSEQPLEDIQSGSRFSSACGHLEDASPRN